MLKQLFSNLSILICMLYLLSEVFKKTKIVSNPSFKEKIKAGLWGGFLGIILMIYTIEITPNELIDLRYIPIAIAGVYVGPIPVFISGVIIAIFRLFYFGVNLPSIQSFIVILTMALGCGTIATLFEGILKRWILSYLWGGIVYTVSLVAFNYDHVNSQKIVVIYLAVCLIASILSYSIIKSFLYYHNYVEKLKYDSSRDHLTGLYNRRSFESIYSDILKKIPITEESLSLLMIDVDFFKNINDTYGHISGDYVLVQIGKLLKESVRDFDLVARIGGEEFCIVLRDCPKAKTHEIAERIRKKIEGYDFVLPNDSAIKVTVSIGAAVYPETVLELKKFREIADKNLYYVKHSGRNKVCI